MQIAMFHAHDLYKGQDEFLGLKMFFPPLVNFYPNLTNFFTFSDSSHQEESEKYKILRFRLDGKKNSFKTKNLMFILI